MKQTIRYLNTDLDIAAPFELAPLVEALSTQGTFALQVSEAADGTWCATLETDDSFSSPEPNIAALLTAIESLDPASRELWTRCTKREFNIGYDCGDEPSAFTNEISAATLGRMAAARVVLGLTLYPADAGHNE